MEQNEQKARSGFKCNLNISSVTGIRSNPLIGFWRLALLSFLILVVTASAAGTANAQAAIEITPGQIDISGITTETNSFKHPFTVRAVNENITWLTFSPGNLKEIKDGKNWISGKDVTIEPNGVDIKRGQSQDFTLSVNNIKSGQYNGTIAVRYNEQSVDAADTLAISVRAADFSKIPTEINLRFERPVLFFGNQESVPWTLALNEKNGKINNQMSKLLSEDTKVSLDPLVNAKDASLVIRPEKILPVAPGTSSEGQGLVIRANFINPGAEAGEYTGAMTVKSEEMGLLATVPVKVQVRYPALLAGFLIVLGIIASLAIGYWNETGKKKNEIEDDVYVLKKEMIKLLERREITEDRLNDVKKILGEVKHNINDDELSTAEDNYKKAKAELDNIVKHMKTLKSKPNEIDGHLEKLKIVRIRLKGLRITDDSKVIRTLEESKNVFDDIKNKINNGTYEKEDDFKSKFDEHTKILSDVDEVSKLLENYEYRIMEAKKTGSDMIKSIKLLDDYKKDLEANVFVHDDIQKWRGKLDAAVNKDTGTEPEVSTSIAGKTQIQKLYQPDVFQEMDLEGTKKKSTDKIQLSQPAQQTSMTKPTKLNVIDSMLNTIYKMSKNLLTPRRKKIAFEFALFFLAIPILAVLGYNELYANNHTFGEENVLHSYLTLFLWGFGIHKGSTSAADALKSIRTYKNQS